MCRYAIDNNLKKVDDLKGFDYEGYSYNEAMSNDKEWVFIRKEA